MLFRLWLFLAVTSASIGAPVIDCEVCVYGGTSGGVSAAVTAARLGKSVALICLNNHVGGMTSGGLGVTDKGNASSIGGVAAEFYSRVGLVYGSGSPVYYFEPHVAENVFWQMLKQAAVPVYTNQRLASVTMSGQRLTQIVMEDGTVYRAREFIDTTYEGDLMAMVGVTYTYGRESSGTYGESLAGVQSPGGSYNYDPYVVLGNPSSGLLPLVQPGSPGAPGQADDRLQTFNYRLCLTQNSGNQIPIAPPPGYTEAQYELVRRYLLARGAVQLNQLIDVQTIIPNGKTDINANGELSTDYLGGNYGYVTNNYSGREAIRLAHENYIRGLLHFLGSSPNVPANVRTEMQTWQLAKDEFQDTGGWPHQMYVREARRMVSAYVMQQQNCLGTRIAPDPVCLGSYGMDCHPVERIASGGYARPEGGLGGNVPYPYGISYRSIIPGSNQCQNLLCTFALSASHVAFASIRMEPVFMMTSQSAATAAAFAIDDNVPLQSLDYNKLAAQLRADKQLLAISCASPYVSGTITLDQGNTCFVTASAGWTTGANAGGYLGDYWHDGSTGKGTKSVNYTPDLPTNGVYDLYLWWVEASNRATNTPVDIVHPAGTTRVLVNQKNSSAGWYKIMRTNFNAGTGASVIIRNDGTAAGTFCIADGVRWSPVGFTLPAPPATAPPAVEIVASDAVAGEFSTNTARFSIVRKNDQALLAVTVNYAIGGTASNVVDYAALSGSINLAAGMLSTNISITPVTDNLVDGDETVTLTLLPSANYALTTLSNATVVIHDRPIDAWRLASFTGPELTNNEISGDTADPDFDNLGNLTEYAMGLSPKDAASTNAPWARIENGRLTLTYTRSKSATDVSLTLEQSNNLLNWYSGPGVIEQISCVDEGTFQRITVRLAAPAQDVAFLRWKVVRL
jgi:hypothetical protein